MFYKNLSKVSVLCWWCCQYSRQIRVKFELSHWWCPVQLYLTCYHNCNNQVLASIREVSDWTASNYLMINPSKTSYGARQTISLLSCRAHQWVPPSNVLFNVNLSLKCHVNHHAATVVYVTQTTCGHMQFLGMQLSLWLWFWSTATACLQAVANHSFFFFSYVCHEP